MDASLQLVVAAFLGLAIGSFINAYIWRIHNREQKTRDKPESVLRGRSVCPGCNHQLAAKDLVPVFSWLFLRGKCRYCRMRISPQYPLVELVSSLVFVVSVGTAPFTIAGVGGWLMLGAWLVVITMFLALGLYDLKWYILPDRMVAILLGAVIAFRLSEAIDGAPVSQWLIDPLLGGGLAFSFFYLLFLLGRGKWMGGGDVKLVFVLGLLLGVGKTLLGLFLAFNIAAIVSMLLIAFGAKSRKAMVPFGPFLLLGAWLSMLYGEEIISWYLGLSGL